MTENEAIRRCDLLINGYSVSCSTNDAFKDENKGYMTFETMRKFAETCKQALEEIQQYRAIGTVEDFKNSKVIADERYDYLFDEIELLKAYASIGTIDEFKALKEKNEPKKAEYKKMVYPSHKWKMEDGKIDVWAYEAGYCNGPVCERCYYSFCEHCNPNGYEGECVVEDYICPSCRENVGYKQTHCKCGQVLDWQ